MTTTNNPNLQYTSEGRIGVNFNRRTNSATETNPVEHQLGTTVLVNNDSTIAVYVRAPAAIGTCANVTITWGTIDAASVASKTVNTYVNFTTAFAAGDYGWVKGNYRLGGKPSSVP